jgi:hypothetical protein
MMSNLSNRTKWLLGGVAVVLVLAAGYGIGAATSSDGGNEVATEPNTTTSSTTSSTTTTTTLAPPAPPATTTDVTVGIICSTPEEASQALYNSWVAGDQTAARRCASNGAVATLFATSGAGASYTFQGCYGDPGVPTCGYSYEGGAVIFTLNGTEAAGWKVVSVGYVAD